MLWDALLMETLIRDAAVSGPDFFVIMKVFVNYRKDER